jgi:ATP-dependent helicase IRC3
VSAQILPLRPYQRVAVDAAHGAWARGMRRPAEVLFTGAGKTVIFAHLGVEWLAVNPGRRVLVLAHTTELVDQAIAKFRSVAPGLRIGRVQADANETLARIIVASVATLRSERRRRMLRDVGLIIVDECHHAVATTYREILSHYGALGPAVGAVAIGFTATMTRADDLSLGDVWQDVVHAESITDGIMGGYLVRPRGIHVHVDDLDLSQVRTSRGDYREGDLGEAIENSLAPKAIARAVAEHADSRKILLFAPTVHSAEVIGDALRAAGRSVGLVHGAMSAGARRDALDAFRAGSTQILCNCMVLTEGFDEPAADCAVIARPTKSPGLYIQIAGRVLRPYPGKTDALLLDVVGASLKHTLVSALDLFGVGKAKTENDQAREDPEDLDEGQQDARGALFGGLDGNLIATEVDLFTGSPMAWLRTRAGVFFLAAGERYIAIVPGADAGTYDVTAMHATVRHTGRWIVQGVEDLAYAMAWAEGEVTPYEKTIASKARAWRAKSPTDKQRARAAGLRLTIPDGARSGEVSAMITLALASNRIDPYLPDYMKAGRHAAR